MPDLTGHLWHTDGHRCVVLCWVVDDMLYSVNIKKKLTHLKKNYFHFSQSLLISQKLYNAFYYIIYYSSSRTQHSAHFMSFIAAVYNPFIAWVLLIKTIMPHNREISIMGL